jgi:hypothetical protein
MAYKSLAASPRNDEFYGISTFYEIIKINVYYKINQINRNV